MNQQNAHEYLPLVQALADGKTLQYKHSSKGWTDCHELYFDVMLECYRIKTEPRTFVIRVRKSDGAVCRDVDEYINNEWERITVQEVAE